MADVRIRWIWGYDSDGNRITEAEPVGFIWCEGCQDMHPNKQAMRVLELKPLPGRVGVPMAGLANSEFAPD